MTLDVTPLVNATARLRDGIVRYEIDTSDEQIRDGLIQRFEFTYELCHRMLRRFLRETSASPDDLDQMSFADLIRAGNAAGLLRGDWPAWRRYRDMRARSSHTYELRPALAVAEAIPEFLLEAQYLADALTHRLA